MPDFTTSYEATFGQRTYDCLVEYSVEEEAPLPGDRLLVESVKVKTETYQSSADGKRLLVAVPFGPGEEFITEALGEMIERCRKVELERICWNDFCKRSGKTNL